MMNTADRKEQIMDAVIRQFRANGIKFTMDDIAGDLHMSKKTIYTLYPDKESLMIDAVDRFFKSVKESERAALRAPDLDYYERLRKVLSAMPNKYEGMEFGELWDVKEKYPRVYACLAENLESGWEPTIQLLEEGIRTGKLRNFSIPIFKTMMETTLEQFFQKDVLKKNRISYRNALNEVVDILINGIRNPGEDGR